MWVTLSDERTGLLFAAAADPRQSNYSRVSVSETNAHVLQAQIRDFPSL
jgi:hypothetical protein